MPSTQFQIGLYKLAPAGHFVKKCPSTGTKIFLFFLFFQQTCLAYNSYTQAAALQARHYHGQTFLTWHEIIEPALPENITYVELFFIKNSWPQQISYRIYGSATPITSVTGMQPITTASLFSGWNLELYGRYTCDETEPAIRYVLPDETTPLAADIGLAVCQAQQSGPYYYAVTVVVDNVENTAISSENSLTQPIEETVEPGVPVLQRVKTDVTFCKVNHADLYYYCRWESPPNSSIQCKVYDYLVAIPPNLQTPAAVGLHLHCYNAHLEEGFGEWINAQKGAILVSTNDRVPYDWWTGYHEKLDTKNPPTTPSQWQAGVIRPYAGNRLFSFLCWLEHDSPWTIDPERTFASGNSMGGAGALMAAIRCPDLITWAKGAVPMHNPSLSIEYRSSYEKAWGAFSYNVLYENGLSVWDYYNQAWYLRHYPEKETGFIAFSNAKNDPIIEWIQAIEMINALQDSKRPHLFVWGQGAHSQHAVLPLNDSQNLMAIDLQKKQSVPAFTHCSLDDNPGNGDINDGAVAGQINRYLYWQTADIIDRCDQWAMTVALTGSAPQRTCTVDITPRKCQFFKLTPGTRVHWSNTRMEDGVIIQNGQIVVDENGLLTVPQALVSKNGNRIKLINAEQVVVKAKMWLEGAVRFGPAPDMQFLGMPCQLPVHAVPVTSPYQAMGWDPLPTQVSAIPAGAVDWLLLELHATPGAMAVAVKSVFINQEGFLLDWDGGEGVSLPAMAGDYYIAIRHRNHVAVMSSVALSLTMVGGERYEFDNAEKFLGQRGTKQINGIWVISSGDIDQNGCLTMQDYVLWRNACFRKESGYRTTDLNLDGAVDRTDGDLWYGNYLQAIAAELP